MSKNHAFVGSFFALVLLVGGGGCNFMGKQPGNEDLKKPLPIRRELPSKPTPVTSKEQVIISGYRFEAQAIADEEGRWIGHNYALVSPQENKTIFNASVQNELNKNNQTPSSFDVPVDPKNTDRFFFSTYQDDEQAQRLINRIYSFDFKTNELKEIYKEEDSLEEFKSGLIFRIVGRDGSKIIVMYDGVDNSPGPCYNYWVLDSAWGSSKSSFMYLDMTNTKKGLQKYTVPKSKITSSEQEAKQCEKDLNDGTYWQ